MASQPTPLTDAIGERIAMVRVLCIGFMIYVHVPDNAISAASAAFVPAASLWFQGFLVEGAGRASAALLSLVSGVLTAVALTRTDARSLYRRRFRSIVVPMLLWSSLTVALYAVLSLVRPTFLTEGVGQGVVAALRFYVDAVFFLSDQPMGPTLHLGFLRDLFVCMLLAPLVLAALHRFGALVPLACGVLYFLDVESVIILRPLVLFAFSIGLWLAVRGKRLDALDAAWPLWLGASVLATFAVMASGTDAALVSAPALWFAERGLDLREAVVYPLSRLFGALAIWTLAAKLVGSVWNRRLARFSSYVFVAFCSHFLVLTFLWEGLVRPLVGTSGTVGYALWFAVAPFVAMAAAALIVESAARFVPSLAAILTGGRVAVRPRPAALEPAFGKAPGPASGRRSGRDPVTPSLPGGERRRAPSPARAVRESDVVGPSERRPNTTERPEVALEGVAGDDR